MSRSTTVSSHHHDGVAIAWIISPHGLGHASRAVAICNALSGIADRNLVHHVYTTVPETFFAASLDANFVHHSVAVDVGMVQRTPFEEDIDETLAALDRLYGDGAQTLGILEQAVGSRCRLVVCDIAPLGLTIAHRLGVPGVLVENFTWDWIYRYYDNKLLDDYAALLEAHARSATLRIQTTPICQLAEGACSVAPVSRRPRASRFDIRRRLGVPDEHRMVLVSLAGLGEEAIFRPLLRKLAGITLVVPGTGLGIESHGDVIRIPVVGGPYHPDLMSASDLVVAKLGYSTVAEAYHAGVAFAYLRRPRFPESPVLEAFVRESLPSSPFAPEWLDDADTPKVVEGLLEVPHPGCARPNGAVDAARLISNLLEARI